VPHWLKTGVLSKNAKTDERLSHTRTYPSDLATLDGCHRRPRGSSRCLGCCDDTWPLGHEHIAYRAACHRRRGLRRGGHYALDSAMEIQGNCDLGQRAYCCLLLYSAARLPAGPLLIGAMAGLVPVLVAETSIVAKHFQRDAA